MFQQFTAYPQVVPRIGAGDNKRTQMAVEYPHKRQRGGNRQVCIEWGKNAEGSSHVETPD